MDLKQVIQWISENLDDVKAMDKINKITFPFTTKYKDFSEKREEEIQNEREKRIKPIYNEIGKRIN